MELSRRSHRRHIAVIFTTVTFASVSRCWLYRNLVTRQALAGRGGCRLSSVVFIVDGDDDGAVQKSVALSLSLC